MDHPILAAVDIGGTKITASISNRDGILAKVRQLTAKKGENTALPRQVERMVAAVCGKAGIGRDDIAAVGISTCSPFERRGDDLVLVSPNLCGGMARRRNLLPNDWTEIPLEAELQPSFRRLVIANDCITAVVAERLFGAGRGEDNLLYVTWSTGIGAGAFVDGHLLTGKNNNAVHIGHTFMSFDDNDPPLCGCGDSSHLEAYVSGPAIARAYTGATGEEKTTLEVFRLFRQGDQTAREIILKAARIFARGLANAVAVLDSRLIVVGGSVVNDWDVLEEPVTEEFTAAFPPLTRGVVIKRSALNRHLGDIAALSLVMPESWIAEWQRRKPWENTPGVENLEVQKS